MQPDLDEPTRHHPGEDELEQYSLGTLPEARTGPIEEHLLICTVCQERLHEADEYIRAVRTAAGKLASESRRPWWGFLATPAQPLWKWKPVWGLALVLLALPAVWIVVSRVSSAPPVAIMLQSARGPVESIAQAPRGKRLILEMEAVQLPNLASYAIEVVDATGDQVWSGSGTVRGGLVVTEPVRSVAPGRYWVRLYGPGGPRELLREFGLEVH